MLILYKCSCENNVVNKMQHLKNVLKIEGQFRSSSSISNPIIRIQKIDLDFNYVYIEEFDRFYFLDDIIVVNNKLIDIYLSVDVLMTYRNGIYDLEAFIDRNEFKYNNYLIDKKRIIQQGINVENIEVPNDFFLNGDVRIVGDDYNVLYSLIGYKISVE